MKNNNMIAILVVCLILRLSLFFAISPWTSDSLEKKILQSDAIGYHQLAKTLVKYHRFSYDKDGPPDALRTPLYPLFISFFYFFFGERIWLVILFQIFIETISCLLIFIIISKTFGPKIALYSSLFYALDPFLIFWSTTLMSDTVYIFLCILAFYFFSCLIKNKFSGDEISPFFVSALFFGMATLVRPVSLYLPFFIAVFIVAVRWKDKRDAFKKAAWFIITYLLVLSPWFFRNYVTFGSLSLSTSGAYNLLVFYVTPVEMEIRGKPSAVVSNELLSETDSLMIRAGFSPNELSDFQKAKYWKKLATFYIKKNPLLFIKHYSIGILRFFMNLNTEGYATVLGIRKNDQNIDTRPYSDIFGLFRQLLRRKTRAEIFIGFLFGSYIAISYICSVVGLFRIKSTRYGSFLLFCLLVISYFILTAGTGGLARFKLPAIPFYVIFIGIGIDFINSKISCRQSEKST